MGVLIFIIIIAACVYFIKDPHWLRHNVTQRGKHLDSIEARKRFCVASKTLSQKQVFDLVAEQLPDEHTKRGAIVGTPDPNQNPVPYSLHFALLTDVWAGRAKAGHVTDAAGKTNSATTRFAVVVSREHGETVAKLITLRWTEYKGIHQHVKDLTAAQDKLLAIVQSVDPEANAFTEG